LDLIFFLKNGFEILEKEKKKKRKVGLFWISARLGLPWPRPAYLPAPCSRVGQAQQAGC
jgi:hypothetical protein